MNRVAVECGTTHNHGKHRLKSELDISGDAQAALNATLLTDPAFIEGLRMQMVRFATLRLSDIHAAEDAVQEALVGALKNVGSFGGRAAFKTWVFAILKNKIADALRRRERSAAHISAPPVDDGHEVRERSFDRHGMWSVDQRPADWGNPEADMLDKEFWHIFQACLEGLPPRHGRLFMMREIVGMNTSQICAEAGVSISNLNVILHRARLKLRNCLEERWFARGAHP